jgi:hypothetical protein
MKSFQFVTLFALFSAAMAFVPNQAPKGECITKRKLLRDPGMTYFQACATFDGSAKGPEAAFFGESVVFERRSFYIVCFMISC